MRARQVRPVRNSALLATFVALLLTTGMDVAADESDGLIAYRPAVPGTFRLTLRSRDKQTGEPRVESVDWKVAETAVIVCDMWDGHYCELSKQRVDEMIPRMNAVLSAARSHGVQIIHSPSNTMDVYADTPYRRRMQQSPGVKTPVPIPALVRTRPGSRSRRCRSCRRWEHAATIRSSRYRPNSYTRQHVGLDIIGYDGISDSARRSTISARNWGSRTS